VRCTSRNPSPSSRPDAAAATILFHHMNDLLDALAADVPDDAEHETAVVAD
jgi:hypothetical protein